MPLPLNEILLCALVCLFVKDTLSEPVLALAVCGLCWVAGLDGFAGPAGPAGFVPLVSAMAARSAFPFR